MVMALAESEWEFGGVRFGGPKSRPLAIVEASTPEFDLRDQDVDHPTIGGVLPGIDRSGGTTWAFTVATAHTHDAGSAYTLWRSLTGAWRKASDRAVPGQMYPLRFCAGGRQLRVYGRPRRYSHQPPDLKAQLGCIVGHVDFKVMVPIVFSDRQDVAALRLVRPSTSGLVFDAVFPAVFETSGDAPMGQVFVAGDVDVPFRVEFIGPSQSPRVAGPGWSIGLTKGLAQDDVCVVDTMTGLVTVNGRVRPDMVSRSTRLTARLSPGWHRLTYSAVDPTNLSTATLSWRPGWSSL